jgi:phosphate transport system permease protein
MKVVLRQVLPGMVTAALLSLGKAIGDAAGVMFTAGFSDSIPKSLSDPTATLPLAIFNWVTMPSPFPERAYAAALTLTVIVLVLSLGGRWVSRHFSKNNL